MPTLTQAHPIAAPEHHEIMHHHAKRLHPGPMQLRVQGAVRRHAIFAADRAEIAHQDGGRRVLVERLAQQFARDLGRAP